MREGSDGDGTSETGGTSRTGRRSGVGQGGTGPRKRKIKAADAEGFRAGFRPLWEMMLAEIVLIIQEEFTEAGSGDTG